MTNNQFRIMMLSAGFTVFTALVAFVRAWRQDDLSTALTLLACVLCIGGFALVVTALSGRRA